MSKYITVSFPPKEDFLLERIKKSCPKVITLAEHARNLMREALDATCSTNTRKKTK